MEVRFVQFFLGKGVSWKVLREAATYAAQVVDSAHPFSTFKFKTDGKRIFADFLAERSRSILDLSVKQYTFPSVIEPYLYAGLEFKGDDPARWFPVRQSRRIVIDPSVGFGQPTLNPEGVPTAILAHAAIIERSIERVAKWYSVPVPAVQAAVDYEQQLAA
jgi:uncharacterized protein (DUF433 family)